MKLSVIIPAFHAERTIAQVIEAVRGVDLRTESGEEIVVDDGSTDGTRAILQEYDGSSDLCVILHDRDRGKGAAMRTGLSAVSGDVVLIQDADFEYDPGELPISCYGRSYDEGKKITWGDGLKAVRTLLRCRLNL